MVTSAGIIDKPPRISTTEKKWQNSRQGMHPLLENSHRAMDHRPQLYLSSFNDKPRLTVTPYYGDTVNWRGRQMDIPFQDQEWGASVDVDENSSSLVIDVHNDSSSGKCVDQGMTIANDQYATNHSWAYHMYETGSLEEYDDEAEVLAQMDLGDVANGKLIIMDPQNDFIKEKVEFRPNNPQMPSLSAYLEPKHYAIMENQSMHHYYRINGVQTEEGAEMDSSQIKMLMNLERARNTISQNGFREPGTGRLYLPIGWSNRNPVAPKNR